MLATPSLPKISCLLVTAANRIDHFQRSFRCYCEQTYPNRELVIVNEGPSTYQTEITALVSGRPDVRLIFLDGRYTLGALRNISIALAHGDLFVQWDDDDFNTPERLSVQYNYLSKHPAKRVCYLSDQLHYYFPTKQLFWENWAKFHSGNRVCFSLIPGTLMAGLKDFSFRYPAAGQWASAGEDSSLAGQIIQQNEDDILLLPDTGYMQVYSYHGKNVWDVEHHTKISHERAMPVDHMLRYRLRLCETLDYLRFDGPISVMGREGLAFVYRGVA